jgi:hypothetical protein
VSLLDAKPHTISIRRDTFARGTMAEDVRTPATYATGIGCWIQAAQAREIDEWRRLDIVVTHMIRMDPADGAKLKRGDRLVVTAGPAFVGDVLLYKGADDRSAGLGILWTAAAEKERTT